VRKSKNALKAWLDAVEGVEEPEGQIGHIQGCILLAELLSR
jgi:hypothetical protein